MHSAPTIIPSLRYRDAPAALRWLEDAFDFTPGLVVDDGAGGIAHAEMTFGAGAIMVASPAQEGDGRLAVDTSSAWIYVSDTDVAGRWAAATAAGAEVVRPLEDAGHGGMQFTVRDPEGHLWSFGSYVVEAPHDED